MMNRRLNGDEKDESRSERWKALAACMILEGVGGTSYAFGIYSNQLKEILNADQSGIQTIGSIGNIGLYLAVFCGLVFDKFGPKYVVMMGVALSAIGYSLFWAGASAKVPHSVPAMCVYAFLWSNGSAWYDTAAVSVSVRNFPHNRGLVIGLLKSLFGLSASLCAIIFTNFAHDARNLLLFLAIATPVGGALALLWCKLSTNTSPVSRLDSRKTTAATSGIALLGLYAGVVSILQHFKVASPNVAFAVALIPMCAIQGVLVLPSNWFGKEEADDGLEGLLDDGGSENMPSTEEVGGNKTLLECLRTVDMWALSFLFFAGTGSGLTVINNVAQQAKADGVSGGAGVYVVLISISNCAGRVIFGYISDRFKHLLSRPGWLTLNVGFMGGAMMLNSIADEYVLYVACIATGLSYGGFWSLMPATLAEVFGTQAFAAIYGLLTLAPALGSFAFSAEMAAKIYDSHGTDGTCVGGACFELTFFILAGVCGVAFLVGCLETIRLRPVYATHEIKVVI